MHLEHERRINAVNACSRGISNASMVAETLEQIKKGNMPDITLATASWRRNAA
nr:hypothetical protein [Salmonella sp.]